MMHDLEEKSPVLAVVSSIQLTIFTARRSFTPNSFTTARILTTNHPTPTFFHPPLFRHHPSQSRFGPTQPLPPTLSSAASFISRLKFPFAHCTLQGLLRRSRLDGSLIYISSLSQFTCVCCNDTLNSALWRLSVLQRAGNHTSG